MGHDFKGCLRLSPAKKNKIRDDPPYSDRRKRQWNMGNETQLIKTKRKRKSPEEVIRVLCTEVEDDDGAKRLKQEEDRRLPRGKPAEHNKILSWNVRGLGSPRAIRRLRIDVEVKGYHGRLCLAWKADISVNLRSFSKSHIDVTLKEEGVKEE
ncbi:hypothetical protein Godav_005126 [Gossypium davidsonii]|uniref:Uncharacterized protein n=1 Tax=Gossypium davidsonii TaxID=34287 RepID=A0A7J8TGA9_GOSDV|nr:hypothetical protein [Gossypium davidsonii]